MNPMDLYVAAVQKDVDATKPHNQRPVQTQTDTTNGQMSQYVASIDKYVGSHLHNQGKPNEQ